MWDILFAPEYVEEFRALDPAAQEAILVKIDLLRDQGPNLGRPTVDTVRGSVFPNMKELRVQHSGQPWRILFAFDPARRAIFLVGGNKAGDKRWYKRFIPIADARYRRHLGSDSNGRSL